MTFALTWLPEVLERAGLKVAETPNWRTRGRAEMGTVKGVICHHTATARGGNMPTLDMLIKGRSDLAGPLCQLGLGRDGTYYVVAAGRANHAGEGKWENVSGNAHFIGIEAENSGVGDDPWPDIQMDAYRRGVAAILKQIGAGANMCCGHKEYAPRRKTDPNFDMPLFRAAVSELLAGKSPPPPIPARDANNRPTLRRGMRGADIVAMQTALGIDHDGIFGGGTEAKVRAWQRSHALTPDGIFGPRSWDLLDVQPAPADAASPPPSVPAAVAAAIAATAADVAALPPTIRQIDPALMKIAFPTNTAEELGLWVDPLRAACKKFDIDDDRAICGLLANINNESNGLTTLAENLNYSVQGLLGTFGTGRISPADAQRLGRKQGEQGLPEERKRAIANIVYGGKWGRDHLGNIQTDDGWMFRGYGPIQLTGRDNCTKFGAAVGKSVDEVPAYLRTREGGCAGAAWFWKTRYLDRDPDLGDEHAMRKAVNTGELGFDRFQATFERLAAELSRRG